MSIVHFVAKLLEDKKKELIRVWLRGIFHRLPIHPVQLGSLKSTWSSRIEATLMIHLGSLKRVSLSDRCSYGKEYLPTEYLTVDGEILSKFIRLRAPLIANLGSKTEIY